MKNITFKYFAVLFVALITMSSSVMAGTTDRGKRKKAKLAAVMTITDLTAMIEENALASAEEVIIGARAQQTENLVNMIEANAVAEADVQITLQSRENMALIEMIETNALLEANSPVEYMSKAVAAEPESTERTAGKTE